MMSSWTLTCDGYEFDVMMLGRASVMLQADAPLDDKGYRKALRKVLKLLPYVQAVSIFEDLGEQAGFNGVLMTIDAYEKKLIPVDQETYQAALAIRDRIPVSRKSSAKVVRTPKEGYVYLVKSVSGHYKIGKSINPHDRIRTFGVKLPFEVEIIHTIKSLQYHALEKFLHAKFDDKRVNGEWFNLSDDDVDYVKSLAVQA